MFNKIEKQDEPEEKENVGATLQENLITMWNRKQFKVVKKDEHNNKYLRIVKI